MGKDVERIKRLLSEGYKIINKGFSFDKKIDGDTGARIIVELGKGSDKQKIESKEDPDLFEFINHFVMMKDKHENTIFEYVDNPKNYEPTQPEQLPPIQRDKHTIVIGSRKFDKGILMQYFERNPKNSLDIATGFWIDQDENSSLIEVDYKDIVQIYDNKSKKLIFLGMIESASISHSIISFRCHSGSKDLHYQHLLLETHVNDLVEQMVFIMQIAGEKSFRINPELLEKRNTESREFVIIMPVDNLMLQEDVQIADVEIYHKPITNEDYLIRQSDTGKKDQDWNANKLRIRTTVVANDFYNAIMLGYKRISMIIDWVSFRSDISFPSYEFKGKKKEINFSMYRNMSRIKTPSKIFCKEKDSPNYLIYDLNSIIDNPIVLEHQADYFFNITKELIEPIFSKKWNELSDLERNLINSMHWLRMGRFSQSKTERLMFLYNSLEFAISDLPSKRLFSKEEIKSFRKKIIKEQYSEKKKTKLEFALSQLNKSSLNETLTDFCEQFYIAFTENEWKVIKNCRTKRNDIIHGKSDIKVETFETDKLQSLIERILLKRLNV